MCERESVLLQFVWFSEARRWRMDAAPDIPAGKNAALFFSLSGTPSDRIHPPLPAAAAAPQGWSMRRTSIRSPGKYGTWSTRQRVGCSGRGAVGVLLLFPQVKDYWARLGRRGQVKMQFGTLRQFCSSFLSHFKPPQNISKPELLGQARDGRWGDRYPLTDHHTRAKQIQKYITGTSIARNWHSSAENAEESCGFWTYAAVYRLRFALGVL